MKKYLLLTLINSKIEKKLKLEFGLYTNYHMPIFPMNSHIGQKDWSKDCILTKYQTVCLNSSLKLTLIGARLKTKFFNNKLCSNKLLSRFRCLYHNNSNTCNRELLELDLTKFKLITIISNLNLYNINSLYKRLSTWEHRKFCKNENVHKVLA